MPSQPDQPQTDQLTRRGRPRTGERQRRRQIVLDGAAAELTAVGYERFTMLGVARRAGASKETLYSWFGNKEGLLRALIEREAEQAASVIGAAMDQPGPPRTVLIGGALALLTRATADTSVALRRAAISSPHLGRFALDLEKDRVDPLFEGHLAQLSHDGPFLIADAGTAYRLFRSLVTSDLELRVLMGHEPPDDTELLARSTAGVERFLALVRIP